MGSIPTKAIATAGVIKVPGICLPGVATTLKSWLSLNLLSISFLLQSRSGAGTLSERNLISGSCNLVCGGTLLTLCGQLEGGGKVEQEACCYCAFLVCSVEWEINFKGENISEPAPDHA